MHPALSIIFFTTASGLGYGLLAWTGLLAAAGLLPPDRTFGATVLALGLALVTAGLLASLGHLGRPARAWRALSQWRTSWLSREGAMALLTFVPAATLGWEWIGDGALGPLARAAGVATAVCALVTVYCTAMIYRSLTPIRQWANPTTVPVYLALSLMSGACWLQALVTGFDIGTVVARLITAAIAVLAIPAAYTVKRTAWQRDHDADGPTVQTATGLKAAEVRSIDWPHTEENYLLKEMGYRVARKHAVRLRLIATAAAFVVPLVLLVLSLGVSVALAAVITGVAAAVMMVGLAIERWLFFAQAKHTVTLYYN